MAKTKWVLLFITFVFSCTSLALFIVSFATPYWVVSQASPDSNVGSNSEVWYGLFSGSLVRQPLTSKVYLILKMTCLFDENVCAYSCQEHVDGRYNELRNILNNRTLEPCKVYTYPRSASLDFSTLENVTSLDLRQSSGDGTNSLHDEEFLSAALWVATLVFLSIGMCFAFVSAVFSIINVTLNPIETILSVPGLFIWNGIAIGAALITCILYGSMFGTSISNNIAITDTLLTDLSAYTSKGLASLGFSYWILLGSIALHAANIGLLKYRNYVINQEPPAPTITVEKNDSTILLY